VRKTLLIIGLALFIPALAPAQDATKVDVPRVEVFGGYSRGLTAGYVAEQSLLAQGTTGSVAIPSITSNGWIGSVALNLNQWFGVVADVSGLNTDVTTTSGVTPFMLTVHEHSYLAGPRFSYRDGRWAVFVHALFGEAHAAVALGAPEVLTQMGFVETRFAMAAGAGLDLTVYRRQLHPAGAHRELAIRLGQVDWLRTTFAGSRQNSLQLSTGLAFRF